MKKLVIILLTVLINTLTLYSQETIILKGSDTMFYLAQKWAEKYMEKNSDVTIQVIGGGSGNGIISLINGTVDLCTSSRPMTISEREELKVRYKSLGVEIKTARDGLSFYLNKNNPVKELTLEQVKNIYTGKIINWKEVGGENARIILYGRENTSGTYVYLKEHLLDDKEYSISMHSLLGTSAVAAAVERDKNAIGFGGVAYAKGVKFVALKKDNNSIAYLPVEESMKNNQYPLARYLYIYAHNKLTGNYKKFIDWILSEEGQRVVKDCDYFELEKND